MEQDTPTTPPGRYAGQLLTVKEVAKILRISKASVRNWVNDGRLIGKIIGRKMYRIQGESVDAVLEGTYGNTEKTDQIS
jgi:excisionase family DNA binding protein